MTEHVSPPAVQHSVGWHSNKCERHRHLCYANVIKFVMFLELYQTLPQLLRVFFFKKHMFIEARRATNFVVGFIFYLTRVNKPFDVHFSSIPHLVYIPHNIKFQYCFYYLRNLFFYLSVRVYYKGLYFTVQIQYNT